MPRVIDDDWCRGLGGSDPFVVLADPDMVVTVE
jgi:hypothetical protein